MIKVGWLKKDLSSIKDEFSKVKVDFRDELDDHLTAINENTSEIQLNFEFLKKFENKLDKFAERLEKVEHALSINCEKRFVVEPLTASEKCVFLQLYTEGAPVNSEELSIKVGMPLSSVNEILADLISKGVPVLKQYFSDKAYFKLDCNFKECQAKENLVNLSLTSFC